MAAIPDFFGSSTLLLGVALIVFLVVGYKVLSVLKNALIIAVLAAIFPVAANKYFGAHLAISLDAELVYILAGVGLYILYEGLKIAVGAGGIVWAFFGLLAKPFVWGYEGVRKVFGGKKKERNEKHAKENQ